MAGRGSSLDIQKKQAQRQREEQAHQLQKEKLQNSIPAASSALFAKPVRINESSDPTSDRIKRVLGNHEHIKEQMTKDMSGFIGISAQPRTPLVDPSESKKFAFTKPDPDKSGKRKLFEKDEKHRRKDTEKVTSHNEDIKQNYRTEKVNNHLSKQHERDREKIEKSRDRDRKTSPVSINKSRHSTSTSVKPPPSQTNASDHYGRDGPKLQRKPSSSHSPSPSPVKKPPATTPSSNSKTSLTPKKDDAKNKHQSETDCNKTKDKSQTINGAVVINGAALKPKHQPNLPKLDIKEAQRNAEPDVDVILKEMTRLHQPLTAIHTPHKDEARFPFPNPINNENSASQNLKKVFDASEKEKEPVKVNRTVHIGNHGTRESLSDESDAEDELSDDQGPRGQTKAPITTSSGGGVNAPVKEPRSPMSSASESASEESDSGSDVSDSDSPSSEEEEDDGEEGDHIVPKQISPLISPPMDKHESKNSSSDSNWSLSRFIKNNESPISALSNSGGSRVSDKKNDSKSPQKDENDELISNLIRNIGSDSEENHDNSGCMDIDNFHPIVNPVCSPPTSASNWHGASSSKSASESPHRPSSKSKYLSSRSPDKDNSKTPKLTSYTMSTKQHYSGSKSSSNSKKRCSDRTPSKEMKVITSTPEASVHSETVHNQSVNNVTDSCDSGSEEIDVESVTPGKEAIPNALRQNAFERSDVTKCLNFDRQDSEDSKHGSTNGSLSKSDKKVSKSKENKIKDQYKIPVRKKSKENKENKKKTISIDDKDIRNIFDEVVTKEILSPIPPEKSFPRIPEKSKPKPASIPGLSYKNDKPSIVVRLDLSLLKPFKHNVIHDISSKGVSENSNCEPESVSENFGECDMDIDLDLKDSKELIETMEAPEIIESAIESRTEPVVHISEVSQKSSHTDHQNVFKVSKRKYNSDRTEDNLENKRRKSSGKKTVLDFSQKEETSHTDDHEWDIKRPPRLEKKERSSSTSSNSSQHSNTSQIVKKTKNQSTEPDRKPHVKRIGLDVTEEVLPVLEQNGNSSRYPSSVEMLSSSRDADGYGDEIVQDPSPGQQRKTTKRLEPADTYLTRAKELKHQADSLSEKLAKSLIYTEAILSFIQCGYAMEHEAIPESTIFTMYTQTYKFLADICRFRSKQEFNNNMTAKEKVLAVLRLRIQSLLCLKLFNLKKVETVRLKKVIDDLNKQASSKPSAPNHAPSPHQNSWNNNRSTGTPSPMSPMPSPANSIGSVGSQGSCNDLTPSKLPNGTLTLTSGTTTTSMSSQGPGTVNMDQRLHSVTQQYITYSFYLVQCHDYWDQANVAALSNREFFEDLDDHCGPLSLHSNIQELVLYVQTGLQRLKDT